MVLAMVLEAQRPRHSQRGTVTPKEGLVVQTTTGIRRRVYSIVEVVSSRIPLSESPFSDSVLVPGCPFIPSQASGTYDVRVHAAT